MNTDGWISTTEFAAKSGLSNGTIKHYVRTGIIKAFTKVKGSGPTGFVYLINPSELKSEIVVRKGSSGLKQLSMKEVDAAAPSQNSEWLTLKEFSEKSGLGVPTIWKKIKDGHITKAKVATCKNTRGYMVQQNLVHISELESSAMKRRIPYGSGGFSKRPLNSEIVIPEDAMDFDLSKINDFVIEKGPYSFKQLAYSAALVFARTPWNDIHEKSGVPRPVALAFFNELKKANQKFSGKFKTPMEYLLAGRPCHKSKENMMEKVSKKK